jgi:hypothetical protein
MTSHVNAPGELSTDVSVVSNINFAAGTEL